jgi:beta-phosphoglucomutase
MSGAGAIAAVVFDFDGVVARTMEDNHRAWRSALRPWIQDLGEDEYLLLEGLPPRAVAEALFRSRGIPLEDVAQIVARKEEAYLLDHSFSLYPGIDDLIDHLWTRLPIALVTGAGRTRLESTLGQDRLRKFAVVVSGDDSPRPKPDPEPYLRAAAGLGVSPARCLVVENAPLGIRSAKAAGMTVVAVASTLGPEHLREADHVVADSLEMAGQVIRLIQGDAA